MKQNCVKWTLILPLSEIKRIKKVNNSLKFCAYKIVIITCFQKFNFSTEKPWKQTENNITNADSDSQTKTVRKQGHLRTLKYLPTDRYYSYEHMYGKPIKYLHLET